METMNAALLAGGAGAWLLIPGAILLGALHGLEPGHSKTMMAAFIVAIRGTVRQAVLLGVAAAVSHTAVVWVVALVGLSVAGHLDVAAEEPYLQLASGVLITAVALWMGWRVVLDRRHERAHQRAHALAAAPVHGDAVARLTEAATGAVRFRRINHDHDHRHDHDHDHDHRHGHSPARPTGAPDPGLFLDAHARAHAAQIERQFSGRPVTNRQLLVFGLTGGLVPCPASITVLLLCLQLKRISLGIVLVLGFSLGLALTMIAVGTVAALGVRVLKGRVGRFRRLAVFARLAPWLSVGLILAIGLWTAALSYQTLVG